MKKILIVVPPITNPESDGGVIANRPDFETRRLVSPIEPLTAISDLKKRGFTTSFFDMGAVGEQRYDKLFAHIEKFKPDAIVLMQAILTFATAMDWDGARAFETARKSNPTIIRVLTGNYATNYPGKGVESGVCDYSIRGEAELTVGDLLKALSDHEDIGRIAGVSYQDKSGATLVNEAYPSVILADLPLPDYDSLDALHKAGYQDVLEKGKIRFPEHGSSYRDIMTSRSCILRCSFCSVAPLRGPRQKYRRKPMGMIIDEIKQAMDQGVEEIHFFDDLFATSEADIMEFTNAMVKHNLKFPWFVAQGMPLWPLTPDALAAMKETGMYRIICPFESGNDRVLKNVCGKIHSSVDHHHNVAVWARALDLEVIGMFVVGMHGETRYEIRDSLKFAEDHSEIDYSVFSIATPLVGTRLLRNVMRDSRMEDPNQINKVIKRTVGLFETSEFRSYEMGVIRTFDWDRINFSTPERRAKYAKMMGMSLAEVKAAREDSHNVFYNYFPNYDGPKSFLELVDTPNLFVDLDPVIPDRVYT
ncbi:MAG: B12-binding domain-containing radical SAM protein [Magnetovibrio sp.]|nr:B12-binding domain-containing radical SAM protein [Magnetovibrio sp.]